MKSDAINPPKSELLSVARLVVEPKAKANNRIPKGDTHNTMSPKNNPKLNPQSIPRTSDLEIKRRYRIPSSIPTTEPMLPNNSPPPAAPHNPKNSIEPITNELLSSHS